MESHIAIDGPLLVVGRIFGPPRQVVSQRILGKLPKTIDTVRCTLYTVYSQVSYCEEHMESSPHRWGTSLENWDAGVIAGGSNPLLSATTVDTRLLSRGLQ